MQRFHLQRSLVALSFPAVLLLASIAWAQSPQSIGHVTGIEGQATVLRQGKFAPEPLAVQKPVFQEDIIQTDAGAKIRITLIDDTVISLGEKSRLELKEFLYNARQPTRTGRLTITSGVFRALIKKLIPQSTFEVITPTTVAAIRGTDLMGEVSPDSTAIVVLEGTVNISNVRPRVPGSTALTAGMGTTVRADEPPSAPTQWSEARIEALRRATTIR